MPEGGWSNTCFFRKAHHSPLTLRNTLRHFSIVLGDHSKRHKHPEKVKTVKNVAPTTPWPWHLLTAGELKRQGIASPCSNSAANVHTPGNSNSSPHSVGPWVTVKASCWSRGYTHILVSGQKITNMEYTHNEDQLQVYGYKLISTQYFYGLWI